MTCKTRLLSGVFLRRTLLAVLLVLAAALAVSEHAAQPSPTPVSAPTAMQEHPDSRNLREQAYEKDVAALQKLIQNEDAAVRQQAAIQLQKMIQAHQAELTVEEALEQNGLSSAFVVASGTSVTVMVDNDETAKKHSAVILALCMAHADVEAENVRIMSVSP